MAGSGREPIEKQFGEVRVPLLVTMAGLPGSGKSTIAEVIGARLDASVVSVDPIESAILRAGIAADQPTGLAAYLVAETMAESALAAGRSVVVDAVNPAEPARLQWRALADRTGARLRVVETRCSDPDVHRERIERRREASPHLAALSRNAVEERLEDYAEWDGASAAMPRVSLDTTAPLGENVQLALDFIDG